MHAAEQLRIDENSNKTLVDMSVCEINFGTEREQRDVCDTGKPCDNNEELLKQIMESQRADQKARDENMRLLMEQMNNQTIRSQEQMQQMMQQMQEQTAEMIRNLRKPPGPQKCFLVFCW